MHRLLSTILLALVVGLVAPFSAVYADGPDIPSSIDEPSQTTDGDDSQNNSGDGEDQPPENKDPEKPDQNTEGGSGQNPSETPNPPTTPTTPSQPSNPGNTYPFISGGMGAGSNRPGSNSPASGNSSSSNTPSSNSTSGASDNHNSSASNSFSPSNPAHLDENDPGTTIDDARPELDDGVSSVPSLDSDSIQSSNTSDPDHDSGIFRDLSVLVWIFVAVVAGIIVLVSLAIFLIHRFSGASNSDNLDELDNE